MKRNELLATADGRIVDLATGRRLIVMTDSITLTDADSGAIVLCGVDAKTITLPPTLLGFELTVINTGAAGNNIVTISPNAADGIAGTITLASSVVTRVGTVDTDLVNTKTTSTKGNSVSLIGTGTTGTGAWYIKSSTGIWA